MTTPHTPLTDAAFAALVEATEGATSGPWRGGMPMGPANGFACPVRDFRGYILLKAQRLATTDDFCATSYANAVLAAASPTLRAEVIHHRSANAELEREVERLREAEDGIGKWLSAALDDPDVCDAMKMDIRAWFDACAALANPEDRASEGGGE